MKVRVYRKEVELKRVEDIVERRLVSNKAVGLAASVRRFV